VATGDERIFNAAAASHPAVEPPTTISRLRLPFASACARASSPASTAASDAIREGERLAECSGAGDPVKVTVFVTPARSRLQGCCRRITSAMSARRATGGAVPNLVVMNVTAACRAGWAMLGTVFGDAARAAARHVNLQQIMFAILFATMAFCPAA
jgi:hypothetical protein